MKIQVQGVEKSPFKNGFVRLSAVIQYGDSHADEIVWFDVEEKYRGFLSCSGDPWVTIMSPLASYLGEDIYIDEACDYQLLSNLKEIMAVWNSWDRALTKVSINSPVQLVTESEEKRTAAFFSGGVDSFYTLLKLEEEAKQGRNKLISDLILVWGFDVPLDNRAGFDSLYNRLKKSADALGKNLIPVITNIRETRFEETAWGTHSHTAALAAVSYAIQGYLDKVYIASSYPYESLVTPWGSHPMIDHLYSSSSMVVSTHGLPVNRVEKTGYIGTSPEVLDGLHVCWQDLSDKNCGRCDKCFRTMITLSIIGVLDQCSTFTEKLLVSDIERLYCASESSILFLKEIVDFANAEKKPDIARALLKSIKNSRRVNKVLPFVLFLRRQWPFRRMGVFLNKLIFNKLIYR